MGEKIIIEYDIVDKLQAMKDFSERAKTIVKHIMFDNDIFKNYVYSNLLSVSQRQLLNNLINA